MMKVKYLLLPLFICFSCSKSSEKVQVNKVSQVQESITFKLDDESPNFFFLYRYHEGEIVNYNHTRHSLDFFKTDGLSKRIKLQTDGPERVQSVNGFYIDDEMIFIPGQVGELIVLNLSGGLIRRYRSLTNNSGDFITPNLFTYNKPLLKDGTLYFSASSYKGLTEIIYSEETLIYELNLESGEIKEMMNYPKTDIDKVISMEYYMANNIIQFPNKTIFNFSNSSDIYYYTNEKWSTKSIASEYFKSVTSYKGDKINDAFDAKEHLFDNGIYSALIHDQFRDLFYRIYSLPRFPGVADYSRIQFLTVLDQEFNLIEEFPFPNGLYAQGHFVNKDGFYVYDSNHAQENEEEIKFVRIYPK